MEPKMFFTSFREKGIFQKWRAEAARRAIEQIERRLTHLERKEQETTCEESSLPEKRS
jgi:hypothetical protein